MQRKTIKFTLIEDAVIRKIIADFHKEIGEMLEFVEFQKHEEAPMKEIYEVVTGIMKKMEIEPEPTDAFSLWKVLKN